MNERWFDLSKPGHLKWVSDCMSVRGDDALPISPPEAAGLTRDQILSSFKDILVKLAAQYIEDWRGSKKPERVMNLVEWLDLKGNKTPFSGWFDPKNESHLQWISDCMESNGEGNFPDPPIEALGMTRGQMFLAFNEILARIAVQHIDDWKEAKRRRENGIRMMLRQMGIGNGRAG